MVNVLVVEDNFYYSKNLINLISDTNPKMRLYKISNEGKEAIDIIINKGNDIDIILLDLKLPRYSGIQILNYIEKNNLIKFKNSIIVISGEVDLMLQIRSNPYLYSYVNKMSSLDNALKEINKLIEIKEQEKSSIEYIVYEELKKLHYNFSYVGTKYLYDAIIMIAQNKSIASKNLKNDVYVKVAKKYNEKVHNVKCNINNATIIMNCDCPKNIIMNYFNFLDSNSEATPKLVIDTILEKLIL